jgi:hypothetical protein
MWTEGTIICPKTGTKYKYAIKHFEEGSEYGINNGRISKLTIWKGSEQHGLCNYERGWDVEPVDEVKEVYALLLKQYN